MDNVSIFNNFAELTHNGKPLLRKSSLFILFCFVLLFSSCSVSHKLEQRGGYLLVKNTVKTDNPHISQSDLLNFAQPKPNKKFLGVFRTRVWFYDAFSKKKPNGFNRWVIRNFGEMPVLVDTVLVHNSLIPMRQYLHNKGFFISDVVADVKTRGAKATVSYKTVTANQYRFGNIQYSIGDDTIRKIIDKDIANTLIKQGEPYDAYNMSSERDRLTQLLRNSGYYMFTSDYIFYEVDTIGKAGNADVTLIIRNAQSKESAREVPHKRYRFKTIYVHSDFPKTTDADRETDTLIFYNFRDEELTNTTKVAPQFYQIYRGEPKIRPDALARAIFIKPGDYFSQKNINLTYNRIQNLGLSNYVSVNVVRLDNTKEEDRPACDSLVTDSSAFGLLDVEIRMVRAPVNGYTIDSEGTNAGGLMGLGAGITFRNKNIFSGAETLRINTFGAFEVKPDLGIQNEKTLLAIFNSLEAGIEAGIDFPTLLSPVKITNLYQNARPRTTLGIGFNYELRGEYERYLSKIALTYEWNASQVSKHIFSPVDLSSISIVRDTAFTTRLLNLNDPRFFNQYTNHLIMAMRYSYIFNNQNTTGRKNFFYFRINIEPAGNLFNLFSTIVDGPKDETGKYTLFGLRFAQYFRTDWDLRFYKPITARQRMVYRTAFGIGVPYGNSISLPFEKGFFAGGANGMRGWPVRSLGPGEYISQSKDVLENVGDLWFEANAEYRFPLYSFLNGAMFVDVGNVWLLDENTDFPGGRFSWKRSIKSLAANIGAGFRFDFSIFVFRIDGGIRLYDPGRLADDRYFKFGSFQMRDINWNFGIGYPF